MTNPVTIINDIQCNNMLKRLTGDTRRVTAVFFRQIVDHDTSAKNRRLHRQADGFPSFATSSGSIVLLITDASAVLEHARRRNKSSIHPTLERTETMH